MVAAFELDGQQFLALNGGPQYKFTEAISFVVNCESQAEIDEYWNKLTNGGNELKCGWLKDKFGLSWQIVPTILPELMSSGNSQKSSKVMQALMQMVKINIAVLKQAYDEG
jgi:predicted 3-demethylubiquinone-9 3-methyltransferase (glyoxalase superfamily)